MVDAQTIFYIYNKYWTMCLKVSDTYLKLSWSPTVL